MYILVNIDMVMDLILRSQIISSNVNKSIEMSVVFNHINDVSDDKDVIHYWFASETEEVIYILFSIKTIL
jgi:hypothetical protein